MHKQVLLIGTGINCLKGSQLRQIAFFPVNLGTEQPVILTQSPEISLYLSFDVHLTHLANYRLFLMTY